MQSSAIRSGRQRTNLVESAWKTYECGRTALRCVDGVGERIFGTCELGRADEQREQNLSYDHVILHAALVGLAKEENPTLFATWKR